MSSTTHAAEEPRAPGAGSGAGDQDGDGAPAPGVTVVPAEFQLVNYEAAAIAEIVTDLGRRIGLPADLPIRVEVDETTPLGKASVTSVEPAVLAVESGALENALRPRQLSRRATADVLGRLLLRLQDRRNPAFGTAPPDGQLTHAQSTTWDVYAMGRLGRLGLAVQRPRWQYHFRLRHGFTDAVDAVFDRIWEADDLTWADLELLSETAIGSR